MTTKNKRLHWALHALLWIAGLPALGALIGMLVFPLWGLVFGLQKTPGELAVFGARTLAFYFFIWAPGVALVLGVKRAYEARLAAEKEGGHSCPPHGMS